MRVLNHEVWKGVSLQVIGVGTNFNVGVLWWTSGDHVERSGAWSPLGASGGMKIILDRLIAPFQGSWSLDFMGVQRTIHGHASVVSKKVCWSLMLVAQNSSWSLDRLQKETLIAWFHFDPGRKRFYRRCVWNYTPC